MLRGASFCVMSKDEVVSETFKRQMCAIPHQEEFTGDSGRWIVSKLTLDVENKRFNQFNRRLGGD